MKLVRIFSFLVILELVIEVTFVFCTFCSESVVHHIWSMVLDFIDCWCSWDIKIYFGITLGSFIASTKAQISLKQSSIVFQYSVWCVWLKLGHILWCYDLKHLHKFEQCQSCGVFLTTVHWHDIDTPQVGHQDLAVDGQKFGWHDCQRVLYCLKSLLVRPLHVKHG